MSTRRKFLLIAACVAVVGTSIALVSHNPEPSYSGKPLSIWMSLCFEPDQRTQENAAMAIRAMGAAAGPHLVAWMRYEDTGAKHKLQELINHIPFVRRVSFASDTELRAVKALETFELLGPARTNAIPQLLTLLADAGRVQTARRAMSALSTIGEPALAPLLRLAANKQSPNRDFALVAIATMELDRSTAAPALPVLLKCAADPDASVVDAALLALCELDFEADAVVPVLLAKADDPHAELRSLAAQSLEKYADTAHKEPIMLKLRALLTDPNENARDAATNVLIKIAPDILTNAPAP